MIPKPANQGPCINGKFLDVGGRRFLIRGVTYGTFAPDTAGRQFPPPTQISEDFAQMAQAGFNTVRTYTVPDTTLLDLAAQHGLRVIIGMPWPQEGAFLNDRQLVKQIRGDTASTVRQLASHSAVLLFAVGNEIPPGVVRWHGQSRMENFLHTLYQDLKSSAPHALLTYVNFPPTEYLDVDCYDICAFNVYLHQESNLRAYLAHLQHVAGNRPLLLAEAGADSFREGLDGQAQLTSMQVQAAFEEGACGAVAFAWTDEWWRGGQNVEDWAFGLVDTTRQPKPALATVTRTMAESPFPPEQRASWPKVSVVVCAFNAADTIDDCLASLDALTYPKTEILLIDDGSRDNTAVIAQQHPKVRVISVPNGGLSNARNVGLAEATGEIIAYTDADVQVDPDWLTYLIQPLVTSNAAGTGGPNLVPHDDPWVAQCVARSPGGPTHVLLDDRVAEHVPGCNMAFRRDALLSIGGFNSVYLRAGDDVDICWRLQAKGLQIHFSPSALVWHHHRSTIREYWRQQVGYGEGEAWLEVHHPEKFSGGQALWHGHIYSPLPFVRAFSKQRVNTGTWGTAAFPSIYHTNVNAVKFLPHNPGWMAGSLVLLLGSAISLLTPLTNLSWLLLALGTLGWTTTILQCVNFAKHSDLKDLPQISESPKKSRLTYQALIALLHLLQPLARLRGRIQGISSLPQVPDQKYVTRQPSKPPLPVPRNARVSGHLLAGGHNERSFWSEEQTTHTKLLTELVGILRASRPAKFVNVDDGWHADRDCSLAIGRWGWLYVRVLLEEHAKGQCLFRVGTRLKLNIFGIGMILALVLLIYGGISATVVLQWPSFGVGAIVTTVVIGSVIRGVWQTIRTVALLDRALENVAMNAGMYPLTNSHGTRSRTWFRQQSTEGSKVNQTISPIHSSRQAT